MKLHHSRRNLALGRFPALVAAALVAAILLPRGAAAQELTTLYSFTGSGAGDGANPEAGLIADPAGNLYGTTAVGGASGQGTVFQLDPSGNLTVLYSFTGADGANPRAPLIADAAGNLYGTTIIGGASGQGTVFQLTPSGVLNVLYSFTGGNDGALPFAGVIADAAGNLYGTTIDGGAGGQGTVFQLDPSGTLTVLYSSDGGSPWAGLLADAAGNLYGTTEGGDGPGRVFQLTPSGTLNVLHRFIGSDGAVPHGRLIADAAGNLYGTTHNGGTSGYGTVFQLDSSGTLTVLHSFTGGNDGAYPEAGLLADAAGNLYGTTYGGAAGGEGTVFQVTLSGALTVLHSFTGGSDGGRPVADLLADAAGNLYGTTGLGGATASCPGGCGTVFELTAPASLSGVPGRPNMNAKRLGQAAVRMGRR
jgi:uncharacterized repeat protein (TIGR03803 family)